MPFLEFESSIGIGALQADQKEWKKLENLCPMCYFHNWDWNQTSRLNFRDVYVDIFKALLFPAAAKALQGQLACDAATCSETNHLRGGPEGIT